VKSSRGILTIFGIVLFAAERYTAVTRHVVPRPSPPPPPPRRRKVNKWYVLLAPTTTTTRRAQHVRRPDELKTSAHDERNCFPIKRSPRTSGRCETRRRDLLAHVSSPKRFSHTGRSVDVFISSSRRKRVRFAAPCCSRHAPVNYQIGLPPYERENRLERPAADVLPRDSHDSPDNDQSFRSFVLVRVETVRSYIDPSFVFVPDGSRIMRTCRPRIGTIHFSFFFRIGLCRSTIESSIH